MAEYVGFDVSKEETAFCVKDRAGDILARGKVATATTSKALGKPSQWVFISANWYNGDPESRSTFETANGLLRMMKRC